MDQLTLIWIKKGCVNTSIYQIKKTCDALELTVDAFLKGFK